MEKFQESSAGRHLSTYIGGSTVALESAGVDLDICITGIDCSTLEVPRRELEPKLREISQKSFGITYIVISNLHTWYTAWLLSKMLSWIST
jgi:hypothetical protein